MVMTSHAFLDRNPNPSEEEIRKALAGNPCMCTGYVQIVEALQHAAKAVIAEFSARKSLYPNYQIWP